MIKTFLNKILNSKNSRTKAIKQNMYLVKYTEYGLPYPPFFIGLLIWMWDSP